MMDKFTAIIITKEGEHHVINKWVEDLEFNFNYDETEYRVKRSALYNLSPRALLFPLFWLLRINQWVSIFYEGNPDPLIPDIPYTSPQDLYTMHHSNIMEEGLNERFRRDLLNNPRIRRMVSIGIGLLLAYIVATEWGLL